MSKINPWGLWIGTSATLSAVVALSYALSVGASTASRVDDPHLDTIIRGLEYRASLVQSFRGRFEMQPDYDSQQPEIRQDAVQIVYEWAREGDTQIATRFPAGARNQAVTYLYVDDVLQILRNYPPGGAMKTSLQTTREPGRAERASLRPYELFFGVYYREVPLGEFLRQALDAPPDEIEELVVRRPEEGDASVWTVAVTSPAFVRSGLVRIQTLIHISARLGFAVVGREDYVMGSEPELHLRQEYGDFVRFGNDLWLARSAIEESWETALDTDVPRHRRSVFRVTDMSVNEPVPVGTFELDIPDDAWRSDIDAGTLTSPQDLETANAEEDDPE